MPRERLEPPELVVQLVRSAQQELLVPLVQELLEHLAGSARLVPPGPQALWVRLAVLELLVPGALALPEHLAGWVHSVLRESAV